MAKKGGCWSGWDEYRNGPRKKVTLPPVMKKEQRKHVANGAFDLLQDWRVTPFENEGPIRAGIRSALCLQGEQWDRADSEATGLLAAAFQRAGARRPSWDQGQRQYTTAIEDCNWCGVAIPEDLRDGHHRASRFCSTVCAKSAAVYRDYEGNRRDDSVFRSALSLLGREKRTEIQCSYCTVMFKPFATTKNQKYCSFECGRMAIRSIPESECPTCHVSFRPRVAGRRFCSIECAMKRSVDPRKCQCCGKTFTPKNEQGLVCSKSCQMRMHRIRKAAQRGTVYKPFGSLFDGNCQHCREPFLAKSPKAIYCSPRCNNLASKARRRRNSTVIPFVPVHMLTAQVIDGWFGMAA